ncbi:hypothetical protein Drose_06400 [Dactylosporangium roseum]|uniref:Uncharacterized protein n=1 Tax=Dactylosporangium roseum TaxID=47989 RepID=A0ABY5ZA84_9ACTN|nr:hypothetical protein [Dactylosporangium roseum]UWZ37903.1 hypothetical protein Drose_06400 [Dactylosporangium roseum]
MARPDDDHVPRAIVGDDGEVLAVAHVSPDAGPEVFEALRAVAEVVRRDMEADDTPERRARWEAAQARIGGRNARLLGCGG